jgi:hypothetical protein
MARRRQATGADVDELDERKARMRARHAWIRGRFVLGVALPDWHRELAGLPGVEALAAVTAAFDAAGVPMPAVWPRVRRAG